MALTLLAGPANAGKVALLLDRYLADIDREPVLIVPTGSDVERVERDLLARCGALLGGSIGTFDDVFERIAAGNGGARPVAGDAQRALVLRRVVARRDGSASSARSARFAGFADALGTAIAELEAGLLDPDDLDGDLAELYRRYRARARPARALGPRPAPALRRRPARRRPRRLGRPAGLRLRLRGPERGAVAPARGVRRPGGRHGLAPVRAGPARLRLARAHGRRPGAARRPGGSRSCRRATPTTRTRRSPTSSARSSRTCRRRRRRPRARSASSRAPARARRSSSSPTRSSSSSAAAPLPSEILVVCPSLERVRAPLESAFGALGVPYALDATLKAAADALRPRAALAAPLRLARRRPARPVRLRPLAVLGPRACPRRLPRGAAPRPRDPLARAARGGDRQAARRGRSPALERLRAAPTVDRRGPRAGRRRCCARPTGSTRRRRPRRPGSTCATYQAVLGAARRARGLGRARRRALGRGAGRRDRAGAGPARLLPAPGHVAIARPAARAHAPRARSCSCSGSRRASSRSARRARRSSTTTGAASSTAAPGSRSPTRSRAPATSSTRRARARRGGSTSSARRRPTTARRASRARSGRTCAPCSARTTCRA